MKAYRVRKGEWADAHCDYEVIDGRAVGKYSLGRERAKYPFNVKIDSKGKFKINLGGSYSLTFAPATETSDEDAS